MYFDCKISSPCRWYSDRTVRIQRSSFLTKSLRSTPFSINETSEVYLFSRDRGGLPGNARSTSCRVPRGWVKLLWEPVTYVRGKMVFARLSPPRATNLPVVAWPVPSSASPLGCPPHPPTRPGFSALFILLLPCSGQRHTPSRGCRTKRRCFIYCNTRTITRETARKRSTPDNSIETKMAVCRVVFVE